MEYRRFGHTDLSVSVIGFGAWGIGGPAMVGSTPIGWGDVDDGVSKQALRTARDLGINFFDTADFYGLGHSEELIGGEFGNSSDIVVATKVGHKAGSGGTVQLDYSRDHIIGACEQSLRRLKRSAIDYYQLHSARLEHLRQGECIEAMERLKREGKIRYWGLSLNTFHPSEEAEYLMDRHLGDGFQLVFNILNQRARPVIQKAAAEGYGIIARMPLQFGLLTGKISKQTVFAPNDHRSFRLTGEIIEKSLVQLNDLWSLATARAISKTSFALSVCASVPGVSTVIPGIKTPKQAVENTKDIVALSEIEMKAVEEKFRTGFADIVTMMEQQG